MLTHIAHPELFVTKSPQAHAENNSDINWDSKDCTFAETRH